MLHRLVYVSSTRHPLPAAEVSDILARSRENNGAAEISGLLVYHDRMFFQVLEGPRAAVEACYARISRDPRHGDPEVISAGGIAERSFAGWAMGYAEPRELGAEAEANLVSLADLKRRSESGLADSPAARSLTELALESYR